MQSGLADGSQLRLFERHVQVRRGEELERGQGLWLHRQDRPKTESPHMHVAFCQELEGKPLSVLKQCVCLCVLCRENLLVFFSGLADNRTAARQVLMTAARISSATPLLCADARDWVREIR